MFPDTIFVGVHAHRVSGSSKDIVYADYIALTTEIKTLQEYLLDTDKTFVMGILRQVPSAQTTNNGDFIYETVQRKHGGFANGMFGWFSRAIAFNLTDRQYSGVQTDVSLIPASLNGSVSLPAGFLNVPGKHLRYSLRGVYTCDNAPGSVTVQIKLGSTVFRTTGAHNLDPNVTNGFWRTEGTIRCVATNTLDGMFAWEHSEVTGQTQPLTAAMATAHTPVAIDLTQALQLDFLWTATDAGTQITVTEFTLWEEA